MPDCMFEISPILVRFRNRVYIFCGKDLSEIGSNVPGSKACYFNQYHRHWKELPPVPTDQSGGNASIFRSKVYISAFKHSSIAIFNPSDESYEMVQTSRDGNLFRTIVGSDDFLYLFISDFEHLRYYVFSKNGSQFNEHVLSEYLDELSGQASAIQFQHENKVYFFREGDPKLCCVDLAVSPQDLATKFNFFDFLS